MIKFLTDHCVFKVTVDFLRTLGYQVTTVRELGIQDAPDEEILNQAISMGSLLLTNDLDLSNILTYPPSSHCGIIILKISKKVIPQVHSVLQTMLCEVPEEKFTRTLFIVDRNKYRFRRG